MSGALTAVSQVLTGAVTQTHLEALLEHRVFILGMSSCQFLKCV